MLVLTRRAGEAIVLAGNIHVEVVLVKGQTVRLGITAPPSVPVVRGELLPGYSEGGRAHTDERATSPAP